MLKCRGIWIWNRTSLSSKYSTITRNTYTIMSIMLPRHLSIKKWLHFQAYSSKISQQSWLSVAISKDTHCSLRTYFWFVCSLKWYLRLSSWYLYKDFTLSALQGKHKDKHMIVPLDFFPHLILDHHHHHHHHHHHYHHRPRHRPYHHHHCHHHDHHHHHFRNVAGCGKVKNGFYQGGVEHKGRKQNTRYVKSF